NFLRCSAAAGSDCSGSSPVSCCAGSSTRTPNCGRPSGRSGIPREDSVSSEAAGSCAEAVELVDGCVGGCAAGGGVVVCPLGWEPRAEVTSPATALSTTMSYDTADIEGMMAYLS